jgi:hypothetical protein
MIPSSDALLVLRGWAESKTRLRVLFKGEPVDFSAFCVVCEAQDDVVSFVIADDPKSMIGFRVRGCVCGFKDKPRDAAGFSLPVGGKVESAVLFVRRGFELTIMLLEEQDERSIDMG